MDEIAKKPVRAAAKPRQKRGRPRKGAEASSDKLLEAALQSFADNGFDNASLRTIATLADVDVALISYRYGSKFGLWNAVVSSVADETLEIVDGFVSRALNMPSDECIPYIAEKIVDMIFSRTNFARLMISELVGSSDHERQAVIAEMLAKPIHSRLLTFVAHQQELEAGPDDDVALFASISMVALLSTTQTFLSQTVGLNRSEKEFKKILTAMVTRLLS